MITAEAPAACAFFTLVAKVTSPRLMSATFPFTDAGKSLLVLPRAQSTNFPVSVPSGEPLSGTAAIVLPALVATYESEPVPRGTVERTPTPRAEMPTSGPMLEKSATLLVESTAATAMTPGYAAG